MKAPSSPLRPHEKFHHFLSLTVKLDKFLQNSPGGKEVLRLERRAGLVGARVEVSASHAWPVKSKAL